MPDDTRIAPGPWFRLTALAAVAATAAVSVTGDWGQLPHYGAALVALSLLLSLFLTVLFGYRDRRVLLAGTGIALGVYLVQMLVGGIVSWTDDAGWARGLHIGLGAISLAAVAVATAVTIPRHLALGSATEAARSGWRDYLTLTKPRIMVLLLLTALGGMFVGEKGVPGGWLILATMGGLALACGGASALNHMLDRDIDVHMKRTDKRPVATGRVAPERALEFGLALSAMSFVVLACFTNVLTAALAVFGNLFYVLVYTRWLKRSTHQNIVIGGAAGAIPPVVGWAAVTGNLTLPALFLFLIVFIWTPPHFWALALLIRREYEAAKVPMLPVVKGDRETVKQILLYTLVMIAVTILPFATGDLSWIYLGAAVGLGAIFLAYAVALLPTPTPKKSRRLFTYSLAYLALLFVAMAIDPIILA
ncbi:MAG: heme o synthase [Thermoleophilia bacterium]